MHLEVASHTRHKTQVADRVVQEQVGLLYLATQASIAGIEFASNGWCHWVSLKSAIGIRGNSWTDLTKAKKARIK